MAELADLQARQVAAVLFRAADAALGSILRLGYIGHPADPDELSSWTDAELHSTFQALMAALDGARAAGFVTPPFTQPNCLSCYHFAALGSPRADEAPVPIDGIVEAGYCTALPPQRRHIESGHDPLGSSVWVRVHGHQRCGSWRSLASRGAL